MANLKEKLSKKIFVVVNTKGGVGKSTTANQVLAPYLYTRTGIAPLFVEVDVKNYSCQDHTDTVTKRELLETSSKNFEKIFEEKINTLGRNYPVVIDVGVAYSEEIIDIIMESYNDDVHFILPLINSRQDGMNTFDTISRIKDLDLDGSNPKISIAICRVDYNPTEIQDIKEDHYALFGNKDENIISKFKEVGIEESFFCVKDLQFLDSKSKDKYTTIFDIAKSYLNDADESKKLKGVMEKAYNEETNEDKKAEIESEFLRISRENKVADKARKFMARPMEDTFEQLDGIV